MGHRSADVNVLVLGDGDLSFSLSLVKRLETEKLTGDRRISVLCTSYDTRDDVIGRYPASRSIIASLLRRSGGAGAEEAGSSRKRKRVRKLSETSVCVLHRVNAAAIEETLSAAGNEYVATTFDLLWFNFPHSGAEDRPRHRALLRHFFASAASLLRRQVVSGRRSCFDSADSGVSATTGARDASDGGSATGTSDSAGAGDAAAREFDGRQRKYRPVVHLALAGQQAERWECLGAATAAGFDLLAVLPFCDDAFPGYVRRRNTKGKSFRRTRPGESHAASAEAVGVGSRGGAGKGGGRGGTEEEGASIGKQPQIRASKSELGARVLLFALRDEETAHEADTGLGFNLPAPASVDKVAGILKHARVSPTVISLLVASVVPAPGCRKAQSQEGQAEGASSGAWHSCPVAGCLKGYRSVRGLKTHMMQFHRPRSDLAVACATQASSQVQREMPSEKTSFSCSVCAKIFASTEAVAQHEKSVHGMFKGSKLKPDWYQDREGAKRGYSSASGVEARFRCEICDLGFPSAALLEQHNMSLRPEAIKAFRCPAKDCPSRIGGRDRVFNSRRALRQHCNCCASFLSSGLSI